MNKVLAITLLVLTLCTSLIGVGEEQPSESPLWISLNHETLSAKLDGAPLLRVLTELERQTGIKFFIAEEIKSRPVWADFQALPLETGIKRLLRGQSYTISYSPNMPDSHHISSIRVLEQAADPGELPPLDPTPTAEALVAEDLTAQKIDELWQIEDKDPTEAEESLKRAIRDPSVEIRESALKVMISMNPPFMSNLLPEIALKDAEPDLRIEALKLLADHAQEDVLRDILMKSAQDPDPEVRETAEHLLETLE